MSSETYEIKKDVVQYLYRLAPGVLDVSYDARFTLNFNNIDILKDIYEGIGWLIEAMKSIMPDSLAELERKEDEVIDVLGKITEAFQRKDFICVADQLEYEIHPILINWLEALE